MNRAIHTCWCYAVHGYKVKEPHWQGVTTQGQITEVKQLWAQLALGWVTVWDTLVDAKDVIDTCCVLLWLMSYEHMRGFSECSSTCKKAGVCAVMPMWLVHIKEHVWTVRTCPTTMLLSAMSECVNDCYIERPNKRGTASYEMARPVCSPGSWSWKGLAPPQEKCNDTVWKNSGLSRKMKNCKGPFENLTRF